MNSNSLKTKVLEAPDKKLFPVHINKKFIDLAKLTKRSAHFLASAAGTLSINYLHINTYKDLFLSCHEALLKSYSFYQWKNDKQVHIPKVTDFKTSNRQLSASVNSSRTKVK